MKRNRSTRVVFPVFSGFAVRVVLARNVAATGKRLGEKSDLSQAAAAFISSSTPTLVGWLVFEVMPDPGTIAHEASHAVRALARHVGTNFDEETFAYHLGHLVGHIHKFLEKGKCKCKKH
jgi:hypothetical protein